MDFGRFNVGETKLRYAIMSLFVLTLLLTAIGFVKGFKDASISAAPKVVLSMPSAPNITEPPTDGQLLSAADVHMETAPFQDNDSGDQHLCSDWEIWTVSPAAVERVWFAGCIGGVQKVHSHLGDGIFQASFAGRRDLVPDQSYELRVRHRDGSGDAATEWGAYAVRTFRTAKERKPLPGAPQWVVRQRGYKVEEVASGFELPVNIAMVPAHATVPGKPMFYVTELYGEIKVVRGDFRVSTYAKNLLNFDPMGNFPGAGEIGLTGIVVEPTSGDVIAAMLYKLRDQTYPKVVRFHSTDGGLTASSQKTILDMRGEPQEASHQISNLSIGPDGKLYVHMGDGFSPSVSRKIDSFRGKVLRVNLDGSAPSDNPFYKANDSHRARDYVFASGFRNPFGGAWRAADGQHYSVENGPSANDRLAKIIKGADYGWNGGEDSMRKRALYNWNITHGPVNITFVQPETHQEAGFPKEKFGHAFVSESGPTYATGPQIRGKRIVEFSFNKNGSVSGPRTLVEYNGWGKTSVAGLAAGPDALYFTGLYPEGAAGGPSGGGAKIYRVRYVAKAAGPKPAVQASACTDKDLQVTARTPRTTIARGTPISITLTIKNISKHTCTRDVGADVQELRITRGADKIWSSDDCGRLRGTRVIAFPVGREQSYTVIWNGRSTSACAAGVQRVPAGPVPRRGPLSLNGRLGTDVSATVTLKLT